MLDLHCHILPGVDDGAHTLHESILMLKAAEQIGLTHIIATPHMRSIEDDRKTHIHAFRLLKPQAEAMGIQLLLGCEAHSRFFESDHWQAAAERAVAQGTSLLLMEFPHTSLPNQWECILTDLRCMGWKVIIGHPERNILVQKNPALLEEMIYAGAILQIDAFSLYWRLTARRSVVRWLNRQRVPYWIASDAHREEDYRWMQVAAKRYPEHIPDKAFLGHDETGFTS